jgi:hypothetical protein
MLVLAANARIVILNEKNKVVDTYLPLYKCVHVPKDSIMPILIAIQTGSWIWKDLSPFPMPSSDSFHHTAWACTQHWSLTRKLQPCYHCLSACTHPGDDHFLQ